MQTEILRQEPLSFDALQKDHALKILLDYAASTKKGWTAILKEILAVTKPGRNDAVPNRQDFEAWARRDILIGDQKFKWVYRFLTHAETLARQEFAHASVLLQPLHHVLRTGRVLAALFSPTARAYSDFGADAQSVLDRRYDRMVGLYAAQDQNPREYWAFNRIPGEQFLVVQHFWSDSAEIELTGDWALHREAGFMTLNEPVQCHMKDILTGEYRPHFFNMAMRADLPHLEGGAWFYSGIATVMRGLKQEDPWEAIFVTLRDDVRELISTDERIISVIVEKFKWSVPL